MKRVAHHAFALRTCSTIPFTIRKDTLHFIGAGLAICMLSVISACRITRNIQFSIPQHPNAEPSIDLAIELNITDAFREYVWHQSDYLDLDRISTPLHGVLADNALAVARAVFRNVTVEKEGAPQSNRSQRTRQAVLTPRVVDIKRFPHPFQSLPIWIDVEQTVSIEWTLKNPEDVIVWVGTATGRFTNKAGTNFSKKRRARERLQKAIDNAFTKSIKIMEESPEIIEYVKRWNLIHSQ